MDFEKQPNEAVNQGVSNEDQNSAIGKMVTKKKNIEKIYTVKSLYVDTTLMWYLNLSNVGTL